MICTPSRVELEPRRRAMVVRGFEPGLSSVEQPDRVFRYRGTQIHVALGGCAGVESDSRPAHEIDVELLPLAGDAPP